MPGWKPEDPLLDDLSRLTLDLGSAFAAARAFAGEVAELVARTPPEVAATIKRALWRTLEVGRADDVLVHRVDAPTGRRPWPTVVMLHGRSGDEDVPVATIAEAHGTPVYVYSRATIERHWHAFNDAFEGHPHLVCYAVKANSNLAVLNVLAKLGSGFDIVSVGELERVLAAGGDAGKVVLSGVGKTAQEMKRALQAGIRCFNVESEAELERLNRIAGELGKTAPVALRVNPDVDAKTHPYISPKL